MKKLLLSENLEKLVYGTDSTIFMRSVNEDEEDDSLPRYQGLFCGFCFLNIMELMELLINLTVVYHRVRTGKIRVLADMSKDYDSSSAYYSTAYSSPRRTPEKSIAKDSSKRSKKTKVTKISDGETNAKLSEEGVKRSEVAAKKSEVGAKRSEVGAKRSEVVQTKT